MGERVASEAPVTFYEEYGPDGVLKPNEIVLVPDPSSENGAEDKIYPNGSEGIDLKPFELKPFEPILVPDRPIGDEDTLKIGRAGLHR